MSARRALLLLQLAALQLLAGCALFGGTKRIDADTYVVELVGRQSYSRDQLLAAATPDLNDYVGDGYRKSAIDDAAYALERFYRERGFPFARVDYEYEPGTEDTLPVARFLIEEGPRSELTEVRIEVDGPGLFPKEELEALFLPEDRTWYVASDVSSAAGQIASLYVSRGYLDVVVEPPEAVFDETREHATVDVRIVEGRAYVVGSIEFRGAGEVDLVIPEEELRREARLEAGAEYYPRLPYESRGRLSDLYANRGHAGVDVDVRRTIDEEDGEVDLVFEIRPGPVVILDAIAIEGNEKTNESFVRSRLTLEPGQRYSREALRESASRLYETGLFGKVDLETRSEEGEPETGTVRRALRVALTENPSQEFYVTPGWGSYEAARLTVGVRGRNFFGTGRTAKAEGTISTKSLTGTLTLTDRFFLRSPYTADLSVFANRRQEPSFLRVENGTTLSFSRNWTDSLRTVAGYEYRSSHAQDVEPDAPDIDDDAQLSTLFFAPTYDTRDSFLAATEGSRSIFGVEWSTSVLGSELDFLRFRLGRSQYHEIREGTVIAGRFHTGLVFPIAGTTSIPIQERFFNGGEDTVRAFREDELGPKDASGKPVGGETYAVASLELRQRLSGAFGCAVFYDVGNVTPTTDDYLDFEDLRSGVGAGLRYMLPIGPLRFDGAWNTDARPGEDSWVLHFAVGMAF